MSRYSPAKTENAPVIKSTDSTPFFKAKPEIDNQTNIPSIIQRQTPATFSMRSDDAVRQLIDNALTNAGSVEQAFYDLQKQRCVFENCGDENLAAAEHYMFARWWVQDSLFPAAIMALIMSGAITGYQIAKFLQLFPSFCPDICPVTPASFFQFSWAEAGVADALIVVTIPSPPAQ